ncbi:MAG: O-antigen ligase family protein [Xanthomonadales bacterium]|nr:O-antigen ligase family protein [Xanthomonadales bacterium]
MLLLLVCINLTLAFMRPQEFIPELYGVPIIPVAILACGVAWFFTNKNLEGPNGFLVLLFLLVTTFSHVANGWFGGAADWLPLFGVTCVMFYFLAAASSSTRNVRILMSIFVACGLAMVLHGFQQEFYGQGWTGEPPILGRIRYIGLLNDPNDLGLFLIMGLPFIFLFYSQTRSILVKLFCATSAAAYFYAFYLTESRGTIVAAVVMIGLMVLRRFGTVAVAAFMVPVMSLATFLPERMREISASEESANIRVEAWYAGLQMFESHLFFGVGAGRFAEFHGRTAHNTFLLVLSETGIIGFAVFIAIFGYSYFLMREAAFRRTVTEGGDVAAFEAEKATSTALYYSLIGFLAAAFFLSRSYVVFPYLLCGMITGYYTYLRSRDKSLKAFRLTQDLVMWAVYTLLGVLFLYLVVRVLLLAA